MVSASGGGGGDGADHYATGRLPDALDADHEIQASLVYWKLRKHARSIRKWLEKYFAGDKSGAAYLALYTMAVNGDEELERWYIAYGIQGVHHCLRTSKHLEISLNLIGTQHAVALTGDWRMGQELIIVQPPGQQQILPTELLSDARSESAAAYKQEQRSEGSTNTLRSRRASWFGGARAQQQQQQQPRQADGPKPQPKPKTTRRRGGAGAGASGSGG